MQIRLLKHISQLSIPKWVIFFLVGFICIALFRNYIANDIPLYSKIEGKHYFPIISKDLASLGFESTYRSYNIASESTSEKWSIHPLIPYHSSTIDPNNIHYKSPWGDQMIKQWNYRHWFGTDLLGRDVLAGVIHGCYTALLVAVLSTAIALIIGLFFGMIAGYYQDDKFKMHLLSILLWGAALVLIPYYCIYYNRYELIHGSGLIWVKGFVYLAISFLIIKKIESKWLVNIKMKKYSIPLDLIIMRIVESLKSIPLILVIYTTLSMFEKPSLVHVVWIIGLTRWPSITRYVRAEILHIRRQDYITSASAVGLSDFKILWYHALPNAISPIMITIAFSMSSAILLESTLSFLGIGIPVDSVSWGSIIQSARTATEAWWVAVFPGLAIFALVVSLNKVATAINEA